VVAAAAAELKQAVRVAVLVVAALVIRAAKQVARERLVRVIMVVLAATL
jgi:hypothetical protein